LGRRKFVEKSSCQTVFVKKAKFGPKNLGAILSTRNILCGKIATVYLNSVGNSQCLSKRLQILVLPTFLMHAMLLAAQFLYGIISKLLACLRDSHMGSASNKFSTQKNC